MFNLSLDKVNSGKSINIIIFKQHDFHFSQQNVSHLINSNFLLIIIMTYFQINIVSLISQNEKKLLKEIGLQKKGNHSLNI